MAATTGELSASGIAGRQEAVAAVANRRRIINQRSGRALEILGHAIEYLTDEFVQEAAQVSAADPRVQAIQILMALNREIYFECPVKPTIAEHLRALLWFTAS
jgi:hypothetical protein